MHTAVSTLNGVAYSKEAVLIEIMAAHKEGVTFLQLYGLIQKYHNTVIAYAPRN